MQNNLSGKLALITGSSRGIGAAIAETLAASGAKVIGTSTSESGASDISQRLAKFGGVGKQLNVADNDAIERLIANIEEEMGNIAILVNNAGITRDNLLMRMKPEEWDEIINVNLTSVYRSSKTVLRSMMKARFGRIINISSVVGTMGNAGQTNYAAAKAGMIAFTKSLAREVGSRNITVNCVAPGFIDTDMTRTLPENDRESLVRNIALGRLGTAKNIADAVLFLASDSADYITGQTLHVNGGMLMP
ncbi:MAG: 3-oxoacyl-ACP reductase FabG [Neisseriaceae bacterium]|nr:3-oxoacyl-ACP reductase FabG [Neisseriaceae bacterium]